MTTAEEIQTRALGYALNDVHWKAEDGTHVGIYEHARNDSPAIREALQRAGIPVAAAWCMAVIYGRWIWKACDDFDIPHPLRDVEHKALVQSVVDWAEENGKLIGRADRILGDMACYSFGGVRYDHVGLVQNVEPLRTVEGNTFLDDGDDDVPGERGEREGYEVEVRDRKVEYRLPTLFIRWADDHEEPTP